jgi:hypothetical protein
VRQFDLFIDGRSYFDLPLLNESTGELMAGPSANDNAYDDDCESQKTGSYDLGEEEEVPEEGASASASVEDWTATGSAIATASNADDDNDSVDGFMTNIDLSGSSASNENEGIGQEKANKGSNSASGDCRKAVRGHRMASAKSTIQRSTARTAEKTKKGTKKLATGTSKVLKSPIALIKRTAVDNRKGGDDRNVSGDDQIIDAAGDVVEEESGCGTDPTASSNGRGEDSMRLNPSQFTSFSALHSTMMPSAGGPQQEENSGQDQDDQEKVTESTPEQVITS